tara:strand:+ start:1623 stop:1850 length:228 start_codon:yes stop_codon:yes gene_type:complete
VSENAYEATIRLEGYLAVGFEAPMADAGAGEGWEDALEAKIAAMGHGELLSLLEAECVWVHKEAADGMTDEVFAR